MVIDSTGTVYYNLYDVGLIVLKHQNSAFKSNSNVNFFIAYANYAIDMILYNNKQMFIFAIILR